MKLKKILTLCMAGISACAFAQTHVEGEEFYKAGQFNNAYELLMRSLNNPQTDKAVSDYYLGMIEYKAKDYAKSAEYFKQGVAANPEYGFNYVGQGLLKLREGDKKAAENFFKEAQKHTKKSASLEIAIANAYYTVDAVKYAKEIEKQVDKARKYDMQSPDIYVFEGDVSKDKAYNSPDQLSRNSIIGNAASSYEMAINYMNDFTPAYVKYADLFTDIQPDYAITMLNRLMSQNPNSALGMRELARAYENKGDYKNAVVQYDKYVKNPSHFKSDETKYAFLLYYNNEFQKGYDYATSLLKQDPSDFIAMRYQLMNATKIPALEGNLLAMADKLYALHKKDPKKNGLSYLDYEIISDQFNKNGRPDDAIAVIEEGIKDFPDYNTFNYVLSDLYSNKRDFAKAADLYSKFLSKVKNPAYGDYILEAFYGYLGAIQNRETDMASFNKYADLATAAANNAIKADVTQYKPYYLLGQIDIFKAPNETAGKSAAVQNFEKAVSLLEQTPDPSKFAADAKEMYGYLNAYYASKGDAAKATEYQKKYNSMN